MPRSRQVTWPIGHKKKWRPRGHEVDVGSLHTYPRTAALTLGGQGSHRKVGQGSRAQTELPCKGLYWREEGLYLSLEGQ